MEGATEHQARARVALTAALASGPSHAYLFRGPRGAGKAAVARAFAAEILAAEAADPDDARRRVLIDPSPHPDLVWLRPRGAQHMVEEVRERIIRASSYRPFESEKRVFVIEAAEQMRDEAQNALLKTLEEPPDFVHLILLTAEPSMLLETIASRCQPIDFAPLPPAAIETQLSGAGSADDIAAAARLSAGDVARAQFLLSDSGRDLRVAALELGRAVGGGSPDTQHASASGESPRRPLPPGVIYSKQPSPSAKRPKQRPANSWRTKPKPGLNAAPRTSLTKRSARVAAVVQRLSTSPWS